MGTSGSGPQAKNCATEQSTGKTWATMECHNCGGYGHPEKECPSGKSCNTCWGFGHLAKNCPSYDDWRRGMECYICGGEGHEAKNCASQNSGTVSGSMECHNCGGNGHSFRDCVSPKKCAN